MAISSTHYFLVREMFEQGLLPQGGPLLEIGEANWYGDVDPLSMIDDINRFVPDPARRDTLIAWLRDTVEKKDRLLWFDIVKIFYELYFAPSNVQAIDYDGTQNAHRFDLNLPVVLDRRFAVIANHGTAEHIFNIAQVFKTIHDYTLPGGLMIHESPFTGWVDHGFYSLQPTLFFDLAERNGYVVCGMFAEDFTARSICQIRHRDHVYELVKSKELAANTMLFTALKKPPLDQPFVLPVQGYYRKALSPAGMEAWHDQL